MPQLSPEQLEYSIQDLRDLQAIIGQRQQLLEQENLTVEQQLITATTGDLTKLTDAIAKHAILLGDATVEGSIRKIVGTTEDPAGLTSLRALKRQTNDSVVTAQSIKALIGFVIDLSLLGVTNTRQDRIVARQLMRLSKLTAGDLDSADVGGE